MPKPENNTIFAHKILTSPGYYLLSTKRSIVVCTSNLTCHCVITGVKVPSYGEIITAAQTPNHSHLFHASGPFRHNCRHLAPAVVHCLTNCSHFGSQLLHTAFKRQGILAGMRISIVKLSKYQNPYETDCHPVFIIVQATLLCSIEGICQFLTSNMGPPIHRNQQTPQSTTLRTVNRLHGITGLNRKST